MLHVGGTRFLQARLWAGLHVETSGYIGSQHFSCACLLYSPPLFTTRLVPRPVPPRPQMWAFYTTPVCLPWISLLFGAIVLALAQSQRLGAHPALARIVQPALTALAVATTVLKLTLLRAQHDAGSSAVLDAVGGGPGAPAESSPLYLSGAPRGQPGVAVLAQGRAADPTLARAVPPCCKAGAHIHTPLPPAPAPSPPPCRRLRDCHCATCVRQLLRPARVHGVDERHGEPLHLSAQHRLGQRERGAAPGASCVGAPPAYAAVHVLLLVHSPAPPRDPQLFSILFLLHTACVRRSSRC